MGDTGYIVSSLRIPSVFNDRLRARHLFCLSTYISKQHLFVATVLTAATANLSGLWGETTILRFPPRFQKRRSVVLCEIVQSRLQRRTR